MKDKILIRYESTIIGCLRKMRHTKTLLKSEIELSKNEKEYKSLSKSLSELRNEFNYLRFNL